MKRLLAALVFLVSCLSGAGNAAELTVYDVYLDPVGEPLAAYQVWIGDEQQTAKIIRVEGGEHPAFKEPPFHDTQALQTSVIKLAAFALEPAEKLPKTKTRIASLHVRSEEGKPPNFTIRLEASAAPGGRKIAANASILQRK